MKWIKDRNKFLKEAKLRDVLYPSQSKEVASSWSERYLDYEEVAATDKIKQGKWKLEEEDKTTIETKADEVNTWLDDNKNAEKAEYEAKKTELDEVFNPIMTKIYASGMPEGEGGMPGMGGMGGMPGMM